MMAIFKREFQSFFTGMIGYIVIAVLLFFTGVYTLAVNLLGASSQFELVLPQLEFILLFLLPILAMQSLAGERSAKTDLLLYSLPLSASQIVLGKYLALCAVFAIPSAAMLLYPFFLSLFGIVNYPAAVSAILTFFLMGAALLAICLFLSSLTDSPIVAAVSGFGTLLLLYLLPAIATLMPAGAGASLIALLILAAGIAVPVYLFVKDPFPAVALFSLALVVLIPLYALNRPLFESLVPDLLLSLAPFARFEALMPGILPVGTLIYFLSVAVFFVFLTVISFEKRRHQA